MAKRDIIVIGGSAGSSPVLKRLLAELPADFGASLLICTHLPTHTSSHLSQMLQRISALPVHTATDGQPIEPGNVYVAVPDRHLLVMNGALRLGEGPRENMVRPSIDPLMRSVALSYGPRAVGVILSGLLNDGASGLRAIKQVGGVAVVQDPIDSEEPSMPRAALDAVDADHTPRAADLAQLLTTLARSEAGPAKPIPETLDFEVDVAAGARIGSALLLHYAQPSPLTCPDCGGVLSEMRGERPLRYRCQVGHAQSAEVLAATISDVDEAVRVAMRIMEERVTLVERMAQEARETGRTAIAKLYGSRGAEYRRYAAVLREAALSSLRLRQPPQVQDA